MTALPPRLLAALCACLLAAACAEQPGGGNALGGFIAALMGPLVMGSVWRGVTRAGALAGFWTGAILFILIHAEIISGEWLSGTSLEAFGTWFAFNAQSPYSAATIAGLTAVAVTALVSRCSLSLPESHLEAVLGPRSG